MLHKHFRHILVVAFIFFTVQSTYAIFTYTSGDLFIGFRQGGNTTSDLLIDFGQVDQFRDALTPITITLSNLTTALNGPFGVGWASDPTVRWGLVGTVQNEPTAVDPIGLFYSTVAHGGTAPSQAADHSTVANSIINTKNYYRTRTGATGLTNSAVGQPTNANSWATKSSGTAFGSINLGVVDTPVTSVAGLDLFRLPQTADGAVTLEGTFTLNAAANQITFTPTAIPEPSTYALVCVALVGMGAAARKRKNAVALVS